MLSGPGPHMADGGGSTLCEDPRPLRPVLAIPAISGEFPYKFKPLFQVGFIKNMARSNSLAMLKNRKTARPQRTTTSEASSSSRSRRAVPANKTSVPTKHGESTNENLMRAMNAHKAARRSLWVANKQTCSKKWKYYIFLLKTDAITSVPAADNKPHLAHKSAYRSWLVSERNLWSRKWRQNVLLLKIDSLSTLPDDKCDTPLV